MPKAGYTNLLISENAKEELAALRVDLSKQYGLSGKISFTDMILLATRALRKSVNQDNGNAHPATYSEV
jgi:hypothetical protein